MPHGPHHGAARQRARSRCAIRAARAGACRFPSEPQALEIGKGRIVREGKKVAILSLGTRLEEAEKAADQLEAKGLSTTVADLRFAKPLDSELIRKLLTTHEVAVTVEEASIGGLGAHVLTLASDEGLVDARPQDPHHAAARRASRSMTSPRSNMTRRGSTRRTSSRRC